MRTIAAVFLLFSLAVVGGACGKVDEDVIEYCERTGRCVCEERRVEDCCVPFGAPCDFGFPCCRGTCGWSETDPHCGPVETPEGGARAAGEAP